MSPSEIVFIKKMYEEWLAVAMLDNFMQVLQNKIHCGPLNYCDAF